VILFVAHARGMKYAGLSLSLYPIYARISTAVLAFFALILAESSIDGWEVARYIGASGITSTWLDSRLRQALKLLLFPASLL